MTKRSRRKAAPGRSSFAELRKASGCPTRWTTSTKGRSAIQVEQLTLLKAIGQRLTEAEVVLERLHMHAAAYCLVQAAIRCMREFRDVTGGKGKQFLVPGEPELYRQAGLVPYRTVRQFLDRAIISYRFIKTACKGSRRDDRDVQAIYYKLRRHFERVDIYRYNPAAIRVRLVDPKFTRLDCMQRGWVVSQILQMLPEHLQVNITLRLAETPNEVKTGPKGLLSQRLHKMFEQDWPGRSKAGKL